VVSPDPDSRVWTLSIDSEVSSTAAYTSIRGPSVLSVGKSRFGWLISLLRVSFSLGVFYTAGCLLIRFACLGLHFFLHVVDFYSTAEEDLRHLFWSVLLCGFLGYVVLYFWTFSLSGRISSGSFKGVYADFI